MVSPVGSAFNTSLAGYVSATKRFEAAAQKIEKISEQPNDGADAIVDSVVAKNDAKANLTAVKAVDDVQKYLLDILA